MSDRELMRAMTAEQELAEAADEIERLRAERLAFATESEERQAEIERLKSEWDSAVDVFTDEIDGLKDEWNNAEMEILRLTNTRRKQRAEIERLQKDNAEKDHALTVAIRVTKKDRADIERLEADLKTALAALDGRTKRCERLRAVVDAVKYHKELMPAGVMKAIEALSTKGVQYQ